MKIRRAIWLAGKMPHRHERVIDLALPHLLAIERKANRVVFRIRVEALLQLLDGRRINDYSWGSLRTT
jgi:hypothetical protein